MKSQLEILAEKIMASENKFPMTKEMLLEIVNDAEKERARLKKKAAHDAADAFLELFGL